jgi:hypothetical protein
MTDAQDRIAELWRSEVDRYVQSLSPTQVSEMLSRTGHTPPTPTPAPAAENPPPITPGDTAAVRRSLAAAAQAMWETPRDRNGPTAAGSFAASVAARQPAPQPEQPPVSQGFTANRAQGASGDGNPPAPTQSSDWSNKPRIGPPGGAY